MRVLLLRPPRYVWPFNSETSAFWPPLGLLCLAAAAREELPELEVLVWDAPGEKVGWRTLAQRLAEQRIDVLGIGEETVSAHEALRAARIVKLLHPQCVVVAGGVYFAHAVEQTLNEECVDVIVRGEGETTFVRILRQIHDRQAWSAIPGLAFRGSNGELVLTSPPPLVRDLDTLPFPAYDLVNADLYGRRSRNHPGLASIEHSRGCVDSCSFCILWRHMGEYVNGNGTCRPFLRTKSAERSFDEVLWLYRRFERRTFGWVDPTFNASPAWSDEWVERMLASDLMSAGGRPKTLHTAWVRADCIVRDESEGILAKLVRAGLRQVMIGVERDERAGLAALNKHNNDPEVCRKAFAIFRERYPQVYTIGTVIFGLPGDTVDDLKRLAACEYDMNMDHCFVLPLTPNPGTATAADAARGGYTVNTDLSSYNFHTPVCITDTLDLRQVESLYWRKMLAPSWQRVRGTLPSMLLDPDRRKRRLHRALFYRGTTIAVKSLLRAVLKPREKRPAHYWRKPSWYDK
ncbi:MAG: radical SAM protein [Planctomycetota bacterium]